jgi:hypothetical protein
VVIKNDNIKIEDIVIILDNATTHHAAVLKDLKSKVYFYYFLLIGQTST